LGYLSPPPSPQPVVVYKDVGGLVSDYEARTEAYRRENREVRLHECRSACTLALSLPNVCVYPDAQVKFHQAYNEITRETDYGVSARLFDSYPVAVRARLGVLTRQYKVLSGVELIALGMRNCLRDDNKVLIAKRQSPAPSLPQPPAAPDPLHAFAQNIRVAVASALSRPEGAPPQPIVLPDRSPAPQRLTAVKATTNAVAAPLPPRRPDFGPVAVTAQRVAGTAQGLDAPQLINGAQPILEAAHFVPPPMNFAKAGG
jgi:hypothetical protein